MPQTKAEHFDELRDIGRAAIHIASRLSVQEFSQEESPLVLAIVTKTLEAINVQDLFFDDGGDFFDDGVDDLYCNHRRLLPEIGRPL